MPNADLGANEFLFTGDRTQITFFPQTPGPLTPEKVGGELQYQGPEGERTFFGQQITRLDTSLGTLLTVVLEPNADAGAISITVVVPQVFGVTRQQPLTFGTVAVKTTGRGETPAGRLDGHSAERQRLLAGDPEHLRHDHGDADRAGVRVGLQDDRQQRSERRVESGDLLSEERPLPFGPLVLEFSAHLLRGQGAGRLGKERDLSSITGEEELVRPEIGVGHGGLTSLGQQSPGFVVIGPVTCRSRRRASRYTNRYPRLPQRDRAGYALAAAAAESVGTRRACGRPKKASVSPSSSTGTR